MMYAIGLKRNTVRVHEETPHHRKTKTNSKKTE